MVFYWIFWSIDLIVGLIAAYFFAEGLLDNTVKGNNIMMWCLLVTAPFLILLAGILLKNSNRMQSAKIVLGSLSMIAIFALLFIIYLGTQKWQ